MGLSQILALVIFFVMFTVIIIGKVHRYIPALIGAALTIVLVFFVTMRSSEAFITTLNISQLGHLTFWYPGKTAEESRGINWQTIIFIGGMMTMVEGLGAAGFFRWLCLFVAKLVKYQTVPILVAFMPLSGFLSMFIDSITVLLFLATVTIELARLLKFDPVPVIIAEIFAANTGGSATMCGDPPNIIIGTAYGFTFFDFLLNTGPLAWAGMVLALVFFYFAFRGILRAAHVVPAVSHDGGTPGPYPEPKSAITNRRLFILNAGIFLLAVALLVSHAQSGLSVASIGVIAGSLTLLVGLTAKTAGHIVKRIDWRTLLFFIGLFIVVGGLEQTGLLKIMAEFIGTASGGSLAIVIPIILWISTVLSAFIDNIPFAATMVPVVSSLSRTASLPLGPIAWALALGTDIGGNATPIGASANVVGTAIADREGFHVGWGRFCKYAVPATILAVGLIWLLMVVRYL